MKICNSLIIPKEDPFINDKFNRKEFIDNLMSVINTYDSGIVMSIDSKWGTGKTTFIKMWESYIESSAFNLKYKPIYFNAWENDDSEDALIPLVSMLSEKLVDAKGKKVTDSRLYKIGSKILKKGVPIALKLATGGILDFKDVVISDEIKEGLKEYSEKIGETIFDEYTQKSNLKKEFKEALKEYQERTERKIIIFIDELDRCRPLYAIQLLERIKHFFELDNFIFVLAMDKEQLSHSVRTVYGNEIDSVGYLRRFIDLDFILPEPNISVYIDYLIKLHEFSYTNMDYFWAALEAILTKQKFSLRDIDKLFANLKVLLPLIAEFNEREGRYKEMYIICISNIYIFLLITKLMNPSEYIRILNKQYSNNSINIIVDTLRINDVVFLNSNYATEPMRKVLLDTITKFLELNSYDMRDDEVYNTILGESKGKYTIGLEESSSREFNFNLSQLWNNWERKNKIINNLMFTNNLNI